MRPVLGVCALIVFASMVQACASTRTSDRTSGDAADGAARCSGEAVLVVRNPGYEVEIVETRRGSGARTVIAMVGTGVHELPIRSDPDYGYFARPVEGRRVLASTGRRQGTRGVSLERKCLQQPGVSLVP